MAEVPQRVYWDSCVFLSYINGEPATRLPILDAILDRAQAKELIVFTSALSVSEVAFARLEQVNKVLDPGVEAQIDAFWADRSAIRLVEFHELIARAARSITRSALASGRRVKPQDALHLATAQSIQVDEFHTYDGGLLKYPEPLGFVIREPHALQPRLPNLP